MCLVCVDMSVKFVSVRLCVDVRCGDVYMLLWVGGCVCEPQKSVRTHKNLC